MNGTDNLPPDAYALFCGPIDQSSAQRIMAGISMAAQQKRERLHLVFQSMGGSIGDGICLHNYFKAAPIDLVLYNIGQISSIAVIAYMGARIRMTNANATFMIHTPTAPPLAMTPELLKAANQSLRIDDERMKAILKSHISIAERQWSGLRHKELWFTAADAVKSGIATTVGDFSPPKGSPIYTL
jgi:ATP-dependent protease ClpP protease subunit